MRHSLKPGFSSLLQLTVTLEVITLHVYPFDIHLDDVIIRQTTDHRINACSRRNQYQIRQPSRFIRGSARIAVYYNKQTNKLESFFDCTSKVNPTRVKMYVINEIDTALISFLALSVGLNRFAVSASKQALSV